MLKLKGTSRVVFSHKITHGPECSQDTNLRFIHGTTCVYTMLATTVVPL